MYRWSTLIWFRGMYESANDEEKNVLNPAILWAQTGTQPLPAGSSNVAQAPRDCLSFVEQSSHRHLLTPF